MRRAEGWLSFILGFGGAIGAVAVAYHWWHPSETLIAVVALLALAGAGMTRAKIFLDTKL